MLTFTITHTSLENNFLVYVLKITVITVFSNRAAQRVKLYKPFAVLCVLQYLVILYHRHKRNTSKENILSPLHILFIFYIIICIIFYIIIWIIFYIIICIIFYIIILIMSNLYILPVFELAHFRVRGDVDSIRGEKYVAS